MNYTFTTPQASGGWCSRRRNLPAAFTIPPTTDTTLVFHYDKSKNKFDRNFYSSALTHGRMSWDQVDSFLCDIEFILKKKLLSLVRASIFAAFSLIIGFFVLLSMMFDSDFDDETDYDSYGSYDDDDTVFYGLVGYIIVIILCSIGLHFHRKEVLEQARTSVQMVINQNRQAMENLGLRWNIPAYFPFWIELCKDYYVPQMYSEPVSQSYFSYAVPQQVQIMPQRPVIQNPIFNQHYQNYMRNYMQQAMPVPPQQLSQNANGYYQPPVMNQGNFEESRN